MRFVDLTSAPDDLTLLARFYEELFVPSFPEKDEREALATLAENLRKRQAGSYGANNFRILLLVDGGRPIAGSLFDYMASSNCGAIEYLLVADDRRGNGHGRQVHEHTIALMSADAARAGKAGLNAVMLEVNDPFRISPEMDIVDPFDRVLMWQRWGYKRLRFPYRQPALSAKQSAFDSLLLAIKVMSPDLATGLPPQLAKTMVVDYWVWANRLADVEADPFYRTMSDYARSIPAAPLEDFDAYVGRDPRRPLVVAPVATPSGQAWAEFCDCYARHFHPGPATVDIGGVASRIGRLWSDGSRYHAWTLGQPGGTAHGLATFFSMPGAGLLGYLALDTSLRGKGLARVACKRIEEQMIRDRPDLTHCYVECEPGSHQEQVFRSIGFHPLPVDYRAPSVAPGADPLSEGPPMTLLRKRLGDEIIVPPLDRQELTRHFVTMLRVAFGLERPESSASYRAFVASL